jgi:tRNA(Met) cytidine acetyltransferase
VAGTEPGDVTGRFFARLVGIIRRSADLAVIEQSQAVPVAPPTGFRVPRSEDADAPPSAHGECRTPDQRKAVEALVKVVTGQRRRPVVLTSDRGRGKSSALGIAAARLMRLGLEHIVVTGPRLDAAEPVFRQAERLLPEATASRAAIHLGDACLEFVPPDELAHAPRSADLILVDEAAAIAAPLLEHLLRHYPRIAFATTVHGYEGTGRGFAVRFHRILDQQTRGWKALRLETPVRWASGDPLERFTFEALLLDAAAAPDGALLEAAPDSVLVEKLERDRLAEDPGTLSELFGLLVLAHYRTRPYDLRYLLDGPNVEVYVLRHRGHVAATALVAREGGFAPETARAIWQGRTRPQGHLLPESLAAHLGLERAPLLHCARIMRIAVHPAAQGRGLGSALLAAIVEGCARQHLDYVGSSFGATEELLRFWERCAFRPVRLSVQRGAASGAHSAIVLRPLSDPGRGLAAEARERFLDELPHQLSDPLRELEPALAAGLLQRAEHGQAPPLSPRDWRELAVFALEGRAYEVCVAALWKLACTALAEPRSTSLLSRLEQDALIVKVLQKRSWQDASSTLGVPGRAGVLQVLRRAVRRLMTVLGDEAIRREVEQLPRIPDQP